MFMIFRGVGYYSSAFFLKHPQKLLSVAPCVGGDLVCLWVLELHILKLITRIICFSLMPESL